MELRIKLMKWSSGLPVAMLNNKTAEKMGIFTSDRVSIKTKTKPPKEISTIVNTITDHLVGENQIAVSSELKDWLGLKVGQKVEVSFTPSSRSLNFIKKKLNKKRFTRREINIIIKDIVSNSLSEPEMALFISAMYKQGMNMAETISLINAILKTGNKLRLKGKYVSDKHSIGGIPGNRTTPLVISICAAGGLIMPKTSSKAITSAAGTADLIEAIAKIDYSIKDLKKIIKKTNACMVWGGGLGIVPADSKIIRIEKILKIDPKAQLLASIMAKKLAMGAKYILIDIPFGKTAKVNKSDALDLKKKFEYLGRHFNRKLKVVLTDGSQPIGNGVGPILELIDVMKILDPKEKGPKDLEEKSLFLSGELFEMTGKAKKGQGIKLAEEILSSGKALEKFKEIIKAQGGSLKKIKHAKFKKNIFSKKSGKISSMDNYKINSLARITGCPISKSSGIYLYCHIGDKIKKRDKILTIYSNSKKRIKEAVDFYNDKKPIKIR